MFFLFFFLIIDLSVLVSTVPAQIFSSTAELEITTGIATKEAKAEMKTHSAIVEDKISRFLLQFSVVQVSLCFLLIN